MARLTGSKFAIIGKSELKEMKFDGGTVEVPVIELAGINRRQLSDFFHNAIVEESIELIDIYLISTTQKQGK